MGEFDMYRQAGTAPNFTDIARRYGMNRHTVAKYWKAGGFCTESPWSRGSVGFSLRE